MLGRAVKAKAYDPAPTKNNDLGKQLFPSSSPAQDGNIEEQFKKARQSSQSIGGWTSYTNTSKTTNPLRSRSPNIKPTFRKFDSSSTVRSTSTAGLSSVFSRADSFQHTQEGIDLTANSSKPSTQCHPAVNFDENDFDDDADLDLDMDFDLPDKTSMAAPPKPSSQIKATASESPLTLPQPQRPFCQTQNFHNPSSSTVPWSSSPLSHFQPPPASLVRQQRAESVKSKPTTEAEEEGLNPRAGKRRTLPWAQKQAEEDERTARNEEIAELLASKVSSDSSPTPTCFRCKKQGHYVNDCPTRSKGQGTAHDFTPLPKDKKMPWNTTQSAIKRQRNAFKEKNKASKEVGDELRVDNRKKKPAAAITLSDEQKRVRELVCNEKKSVFFTGSAGTGKSVLMRAIIADLRRQYAREPDRIAVTASTGLAACNIGGITLHSFGGIGLGKEDVPTLVKKIKRNAKAKNRWIKTKVLVIDEISMVDGDLFDKLEGIARAMRNNGRPFGGIQLVVTGDFFQLPPVPDYDKKERGAKFAFDASTWSTSIHHTIGLTEVFRQKDPGI
jgi:ATP-dependent DNA helicase PIF1